MYILLLLLSMLLVKAARHVQRNLESRVIMKLRRVSAPGENNEAIDTNFFAALPLRNPKANYTRGMRLVCIGCAGQCHGNDCDRPVYDVIDFWVGRGPRASSVSVGRWGGGRKVEEDRNSKVKIKLLNLVSTFLRRLPFRVAGRVFVRGLETGARL